MKKNLVVCISLLSFSSIYAQTTPSAAISDNPYVFVEQQPVFNGDLDNYLSKKIKYPKKARKKNIQGTVYVSFIVERDGSISSSSVFVARHEEEKTLLEREAMRVVCHMPKWKPGLQGGKPVRVRYTLPVSFRLE